MGNKSSAMSSAVKSSQGSVSKAKSAPFPIKKVRILTYNVWFDSYAFDDRMKYIIDTTLEHKPHICCFQEVLPAFASMLMNHAELKEIYEFSSFRTNGYDTMTIALKELSPRFENVSFPTNMGRSLLKTICQVNSTSVAIGNVHLESLSSERTRRKQIVICRKELEKYDTSILVGDFNFCSERNFHQIPNIPLENNVLEEVMPNYVDMWPHLRQKNGKEKDMGYTFDSHVNKMISNEERMRYDRVLFRSRRSQGNEIFKPTDISLLGVRALEKGSDSLSQVWPSDHFGLLATFEILSDGLDVSAENIEDSSSPPPMPSTYNHNKLKGPQVTDAEINDNRQKLAAGTTTVVTKRDGTRYVERTDERTGEVFTELVGKASHSCPQCGKEMGFQIDTTRKCDECLLVEKPDAFIPQSTLNSRINTLIQKAIRLEINPLRLLAIDFDATICQIHTYGHWRGSASTLAAHIRPVFRAILQVAAEVDPGLLRVGIVTFSGQKGLIQEAIEIIVGKRAMQKMFFRTAYRDWSEPEDYVPKNPFMTGKQPHIASIINEIRMESGEKINEEQVLLIDDDVKNIACAKEYNHRTVIFPALPLPGINMRSPAMEATGVHVVMRYQLVHGALLCISRGSVVDFAAPGRGAIVNAANRRGLGGGGVDGAISAAGGNKLLSARKAWPKDESGNRIPVGECRLTGPDTYGTLKVSYILHTAGPNYNEIVGLDESRSLEDSLQQGNVLLTSCYRNVMRCAKENDIELLGFSLLSAGVYRGKQSLSSVLTLAIETIAEEVYENLREVHLVAYSQEEVDVLMRIVEDNPPVALKRGAGDGLEIGRFLDDLENAALT